ncbi:hypothetical protein [Paraburkholderia heleia]
MLFQKRLFEDMRQNMAESIAIVRFAPSKRGMDNVIADMPFQKESPWN